MKKILFAAVLFITSFNAFALKDVSGICANGGIAFPYLVQHSDESDIDTKEIRSFGISLNTRMQTRIRDLGLFLDGNLYFPSSETLYYCDNTTKTLGRSEFDSFVGVDALGGLYKTVAKTDKITIPAGFGLHLNSLSYSAGNKTSYKEKSLFLGFGGWVSCELTITDNIGLFASAKLAWDWWNQTNITAASIPDVNNSGFTSSFLITPAFGVSYRM